MKIGVFDSGLGGLIITNALVEALPQYDYIYLGDTARVPYGNRSQEAIYHFTQEAIDYLMARDCALVITACNTVSVDALVKINKFDLPSNYPDRYSFGVILPTASEVINRKVQRVGVIGTAATIQSEAYPKTLRRLDPSIEVLQQATPLLVPLIENNGTEWARPIITQYLLPLIKANIDSIVLGCTHYSFFRDIIQEILGDDVQVISQDEVMPKALKKFISQHTSLQDKLSTNGSVEYLVTDVNQSFREIANRMTGTEVKLQKAMIAKEM